MKHVFMQGDKVNVSRDVYTTGVKLSTYGEIKSVINMKKEKVYIVMWNNHEILVKQNELELCQEPQVVDKTFKRKTRVKKKKWSYEIVPNPISTAKLGVVN